MLRSVCLVTAPTSTDHEDVETARSAGVRAAARAPKLGILALASMLERAGIEPVLFDLDEAYGRYLDCGNRGLSDFPAWVAPRLAATGAPLFGFGSICSSYPITIRVAEALKRQAPDAATLLGGPQASAVDMRTLAAFPFIDFVLRGEADLSLPLFLEQWGGARRFGDVPGLTWRSPFGILRNREAPLIEDLDDLPLPAFHLSPSLADAEYSFLELGRGCPFSCTFCSTNDFFRRRFRLKSPRRVLEDMRVMAARYGFRGFNLVHDMFTVDRRRVLAFCETMIEAGEGFTWSCSARTDCVDTELLESMARAGCDGVFFGIETGSARMQRVIDKDLDPVQARSAIETCERLGISATVSTIVGFPEETEADLRETVNVYLHAMRFPRSLPQVNVLAPLSGTPVYEQHKDRLVLEENYSHLSYPGRTISDPDRALIRAWPAIFPNFYTLPTPGLDRPELLEMVEFLVMADRQLRWLTVALHERCGHIVDIFRQWRRHRIGIRPEVGGAALRAYYDGDLARRDFLAYVRHSGLSAGDSAVEALLAFEERLAAAQANAPRLPDGLRRAARLHSHAIPVRAREVHIVEAACDLQNVVDSLKGESRLRTSARRRWYRTGRESSTELSLAEITPPVARALLLCDGCHSVADLEARSAGLFRYCMPLRRVAVRELLDGLRKQGLIEIYTRAARPGVTPEPREPESALQTGAETSSRLPRRSGA